MFLVFLAAGDHLWEPPALLVTGSIFLPKLGFLVIFFDVVVIQECRSNRRVRCKIQTLTTAGMRPPLIHRRACRLQRPLGIGEQRLNQNHTPETLLLQVTKNTLAKLIELGTQHVRMNLSLRNHQLKSSRFKHTVLSAKS